MESGGFNYKVVFEKDGVNLHTSARKHADHNSLIPGVLRIVEKDRKAKLEWTPIGEEKGSIPHVTFTKKDCTQAGYSPSEEEATFDPGYEPDWAVISPVRTSPRGKSTSSPEVCGKNIKESGNWQPFSLPVSELYSIRRSSYPLRRSFIILTSCGGEPLPALHFHKGGTKGLLQVLQRYVMLTPSPVDSRLFLVHSHDSGALSQSFDELQLFDDGTPDLVSRFIQDPYTTTFSGFSKVTNFFRGALRQPDSRLGRPGIGFVGSDDEPGFELITCEAELGPRPVVQRLEPLNGWKELLDSEGRVQNPEQVKECIFKGGVAPALRHEVWKFLLGFYPWKSTAQEREEILRQKTDEYFRMKVQWKSVSEEQEMRNSLLRGYRSLIERDVSRTDRNNRFYSGNENPGLTLLNDVLMTYCMYNFDLGYVQGMSDLLSPILFVTQNEVEAFWCLVAFMEIVHSNFEESQEGMKQQLIQLNILLRTIDPELCDFLDSKDSGTLCFCFRWLLIWFKREFSFQDILNLWEVLWTGHLCVNFHLLVACAILDSQREQLIGSNFDFNEILKHINELTMKLDLKDILCRAESIFKQLAACPDLPSKVQVVLGQARPSEEVGFDRTENSPSSSEDTQPGLPLSEAQTSSTSPTESSIEVLPTPPSEP
ncbi:TBC1 domain family member 17 isoform X1 [Erpetoichthys calabaricus]|uniref:TBC1 domain family member 17 isoform X1 n=1 Tax=Erpetoichthys calabaricus TaxID=27687 RepID=UPI0010A06D2E|nr:TBC1 domain family member 17 isoform X1 [Erpetoichthys calabaricus]